MKKLLLKALKATSSIAKNREYSLDLAKSREKNTEYNKVFKIKHRNI